MKKVTKRNHENALTNATIETTKTIYNESEKNLIKIEYYKKYIKTKDILIDDIRNKKVSLAVETSTNNGYGFKSKYIKFSKELEIIYDVKIVGESKEFLIIQDRPNIKKSRIICIIK